MSRKQRQQNGSQDSAPVAFAAAPTPSIRPSAFAGRAGGQELQSPSNALGRTASARPAASPSIEEIRIRAYELYLARNGRNGTPEGDWAQAERDLRERSGRDTL